MMLLAETLRSILGERGKYNVSFSPFLMISLFYFIKVLYYEP